MAEGWERTRAYFEAALALDEATHGPQHPRVAADLAHLGAALEEGGDLKAAWRCFARALAIDQQVYGPQHPHVAGDLSSIGQILHALGDPIQARAYLEQALAINEVAYGPTDGELLSDLNNLGVLLSELGDYAAAQAYLSRALTIATADGDHQEPVLATIRANLAQIEQQLQGEFGREGRRNHAKR